MRLWWTEGHDARRAHDSIETTDHLGRGNECLAVVRVAEIERHHDIVRLTQRRKPIGVRAAQQNAGTTGSRLGHELRAQASACADNRDNASVR